MTVCGIKHADGVCVMGECPYFKKCCPHYWLERKSESMTKEIKIKCDDCKFVEDCVDYGWQECKRFTPKPSEPMTEEEWLRTATTEELADVLWEKINGAFNSGYACCNLKQDKDYVGRYKRFREWLKQPHTPKE